MNIVFLTRLDPKDINNWSGSLYHIYQKLKEKHTIEIIGPEILNQLTLFVRGNFSGSTSIPYDRYVKHLGCLLSERINTLKYDLIFFGDLIFIPLDVNIPTALLSDMTFEQVIIHDKKQAEIDIEHYLNLERLLLNMAFKIIYCSEWIKQKTIDFYHINPDNIEVVEFGANIPTPQNYSIEIEMDICRLVFIGIDWERKRGDMVLQIYQILRKERFPCTLTIIGSIPKDKQEEDENLTIIPFLDKSKEEDLKKLGDILSESHFLVLPTRFDAFGIVFWEASAYALPSIAADVGGVSQVVKEGRNGHLLPADATVADYAEKIKTVFNDKENYFKLRASSRIEFETRLNWDVWGEKVNKILEDAVAKYNKLRKYT